MTLKGIRTLIDAPDVPADMQFLLLDLDVNAGADDVDTTSLRVDFVDTGGQVYAPSTLALGHSTYDEWPPVIPALSSLAASVGYVVPRTLAGGRWVISNAEGESIAFVVAFTPPVANLRYEGIDVRLISVTSAEGQITTKLRIYNGRAETLHFTQDDIWLALGYAPEPPGPRNPAEGLTPFDLLPEQAVDLMLVWYWGSEPYASLGVGEYRFAVQLIR